MKELGKKIAQLPDYEFGKLPYDYLTTFLNVYYEEFGKLPNFDNSKKKVLKKFLSFINEKKKEVKEDVKTTTTKKRKKKLKIPLLPKKKYILKLDEEVDDGYFDPVVPIDHGQVKKKKVKKMDKKRTLLLVLALLLFSMSAFCFVKPFM